MKISFILDEYYSRNKIFDLEHKENRDNCFYAYSELKNIFQKNNFDLSTYDLNNVENSKIVLYNDMPKELPKKENIHKSYLLLFESELIKPDNWDFKKHKYFNKIFTWDDRLIDNKKYFKINFSHHFPDSVPKDLDEKENFCILIAGNKMVHHPLELYSKRIEAIRWFEKNHIEDFDFYGMGWDRYTHPNKYIRFVLNKIKIPKVFKPNYPSYKGSVISKNEILKKYKFSICYENARDISGYITEKIFDCFFAGCIPVYWGANNISKYIPHKCFIDKRKFNSYEELYVFMKNMSNDEYINYLENIENYLKSEKSYQFSAEYFAKTIVETVVDDII